MFATGSAAIHMNRFRRPKCCNGQMNSVLFQSAVSRSNPLVFIFLVQVVISMFSVAFKLMRCLRRSAANVGAIVGLRSIWAQSSAECGELLKFFARFSRSGMENLGWQFEMSGQGHFHARVKGKTCQEVTPIILPELQPG